MPILYMPISFVRTKEIGERKTAGVPPDPAAERIFKMRSGWRGIQGDSLGALSPVRSLPRGKE